VGSAGRGILGSGLSGGKVYQNRRAVGARRRRLGASPRDRLPPVAGARRRRRALRQQGGAQTRTMRGRVLITGASGALGASVVRRFVAGGQRVLALYSTEGHEIAALAPPDRLAVRRADLASTAEVDRLFAEDLEGDAPPAVAHLVGGFRYGKLRDLSDEDWSFLLRVNLETTFRIARASARCFERAGGGTLVVVSSPAALLGEAGVGAYAAAKAGTLRLIESLAREMAPFGGRANAVLPGTMDTPANRRSMPQADPAKWVKTEAVAEVIYYLTTPAAAGVNGAAIRVPGPAL
jgi:NAD(P)-dependent dehydrogenase (short-subunit alcohol dehydrogenase family)